MGTVRGGRNWAWIERSTFASYVQPSVPHELISHPESLRVRFAVQVYPLHNPQLEVPPRGHLTRLPLQTNSSIRRTWHATRDVSRCSGCLNCSVSERGRGCAASRTASSSSERSCSTSTSASGAGPAVVTVVTSAAPQASAWERSAAQQRVAYSRDGSLHASVTFTNSRRKAPPSRGVDPT